MSSFSPHTHPFFDKHNAVIKALWNLQQSPASQGDKLAELKKAVGSEGANGPFDIYDEKTGESRAKVTPLIIACFEGDYNVIKFLLDNGADPSKTETDHNLTPIHVLVDGPYKGQTLTESQRAELIRTMIAKGADVNHVDKYEMAPIHKAIIHDRPECLDVLIEAKVDPNAVFKGETALSIAARQNRDRLMKKLLDYPATKSDLLNASGGTILHFAAAGMVDSPECVELLLKAGLNVNVQDQRGNTPTMVACFFNKPRILKALIAAKPDLSLKNNTGKDAAALCAERDNEECKAIIESASK